MFQVRRRVFETNSSSTHSICVVTDNKSGRYIPDKLLFECGEFGWGFENYHDIGDKASYFFTAVCELYGSKSKEIMNDITDYLNKVYGVDSFVKYPVFKKSKYGDKEYEFMEYDKPGYGYIDHAEELREFTEALIENKELLADFLFSDDSFVATGNDNCYEDERSTMEDPPTDLEYRSFYKGN